MFCDAEYLRGVARAPELPEMKTFRRWVKRVGFICETAMGEEFQVFATVCLAVE
ncbi:hypothetical protein EMIT0158MI4_90304 [Burkholderia ambifaria]